MPKHALLWIDNLPHIGGGHPRRDGIVAELFLENARRYLEGELLLSVVDREKGY